MTNQVAKYPFKQLMNSQVVKDKFNNVLGKRSTQFMTSLINTVNENYQLKKADPNSIVSSALVAAALDLPINQNLGYMYIVPYGKTATPQIGYKGYIQLAQRSGQYKHLNAIPVYKGELKSWNPLTEEVVYEPQQDRDTNEDPIGYLGYMELLNGFSKTVYWTRKQIDDHRKEFSKSGGNGDKPKGVWAAHYDAMALKTVLRNMLTKWGPMTVDVQTASLADSGSYEHFNEGPRDVTPADSQEEQTQNLLNDFHKSKGQSTEQTKKPVKEAKNDDGQQVQTSQPVDGQEELFEPGTIHPTDEANG